MVHISYRLYKIEGESSEEKSSKLEEWFIPFKDVWLRINTINSSKTEYIKYGLEKRNTERGK